VKQRLSCIRNPDGIDVVTDYAEQGTLKERIKDASIHLSGFTLT
jgi:hypothetical protein